MEIDDAARIRNLIESMPDEAFSYNVKFAAKLTFAERCAIYALFYKDHITKGVLAYAFGLNRRTVGHIVNEASPFYKNVRRRAKMYGLEDLYKEYVTEEIVSRVAEAAKLVVAHASTRVADKNSRDEMAPQRRASRAEGYHEIQNEYCASPHRIKVEYCEDFKLMDGRVLSCWGFYDLSLPSPFDEVFQCVGEHDEVFKTSQEALSYARVNCAD